MKPINRSEFYIISSGELKFPRDIISFVSCDGNNIEENLNKIPSILNPKVYKCTEQKNIVQKVKVVEVNQQNLSDHEKFLESSNIYYIITNEHGLEDPNSIITIDTCKTRAILFWCQHQKIDTKIYEVRLRENFNEEEIIQALQDKNEKKLSGIIQ